MQHAAHAVLQAAQGACTGCKSTSEVCQTAFAACLAVEARLRASILTHISRIRGSSSSCSADRSQRQLAGLSGHVHAAPPTWHTYFAAHFPSQHPLTCSLISRPPKSDGKAEWCIFRGLHLMLCANQPPHFFRTLACSDTSFHTPLSSSYSPSLTASLTSCCVAPMNGSEPLSSRYKMTPQLHISASRP